MSGMIERVAEAIRDVNADTVGLSYTELTLAMARAAIEAMRASAGDRPADCADITWCGWRHVKTEPDIGLYLCHNPNCRHMIQAATSTLSSKELGGE